MILGVNFSERLHARMLEFNTRLCLGLDPRPESHPNTHPKQFDNNQQATATAVLKHCLDVLEATAPYIACIKPQVAFYEALGIPGLEVLDKICHAAKELDLPIILDAKRGDFPSTAEAYASAWLTGERAGTALTVNPFLGFETLAPFLGAATKNDGAIFVLVKTSNPGSSDLQNLQTANGTISEIIAKHLAELATKESGYGAVGAVVGATHTQELEHFRKLMPNVLLLLPGLGAQGAKASDLAPAFDANNLGAIASSSRAIQYASTGSDYANAARDAARTMRNELETALQNR
jgi:orotidine-5'-phosphate decarboxylase